MKESIVKFLTSYHTESIVEDYSIDSIFEINVPSVGMGCSIHNLLELQYFPAVHSFLILLQTHFSQMLYFKYSKLDVIGRQIEFPTDQRTWLLYQYCVYPYLSCPYALVALRIKTSNLARLIYLLDFIREGVSFGRIEFRILQEAQLLAIFEESDKFDIVLILDCFVCEHGCLFELVLSALGEEGDIAYDKEERVPDKVTVIFLLLLVVLGRGVPKEVESSEYSEEKHLDVDGGRAKDGFITYLGDGSDYHSSVAEEKFLLEFIAVYSCLHQCILRYLYLHLVCYDKVILYQIQNPRNLPLTLSMVIEGQRKHSLLKVGHYFDGYELNDRGFTLRSVGVFVNLVYRKGLGFLRNYNIFAYGLFWNILDDKYFLYYSYIISTSPRMHDSSFFSSTLTSHSTFLSFSIICESFIEQIVYFNFLRTTIRLFMMAVSSTGVSPSTKKSILPYLQGCCECLLSVGYKDCPISSRIDSICLPVANSLKRMLVRSISRLQSRELDICLRTERSSLTE